MILDYSDQAENAAIKAELLKEAKERLNEVLGITSEEAKDVKGKKPEDPKPKGGKDPKGQAAADERVKVWIFAVYDSTKIRGGKPNSIFVLKLVLML